MKLNEGTDPEHKGQWALEEMLWAQSGVHKKVYDTGSISNPALWGQLGKDGNIIKKVSLLCSVA